MNKTNHSTSMNTSKIPMNNNKNIQQTNLNGNTNKNLISNGSPLGKPVQHNGQDNHRPHIAQHRGREEHRSHNNHFRSSQVHLIWINKNLQIL